MTTDLTSLAARLTELAEAPAPPSRIDVDRARVQGRRRRYRRRAGVLLGTLGVVAALVLATGLAGTAVPAPAGRAVVTGDPLVAHASFGWLPPSAPSVGYGVYAEGDRTMARGTGNMGARILLSLFPAGTTPTLGSFAPRQREGGRADRTDRRRLGVLDDR
jgi:hypothetical protein